MARFAVSWTSISQGCNARMAAPTAALLRLPPDPSLPQVTWWWELVGLATNDERAASCTAAWAANVARHAACSGASTATARCTNSTRRHPRPQVAGSRAAGRRGARAHAARIDRARARLIMF
jgi:hypothetical protein